jgi:hypothetical protein
MDGEEEREVSIQPLEGVYPNLFFLDFYISADFKLELSCGY